MEELFYGLVRWSRGSYRNKEDEEEEKEQEEETESRKEIGRWKRKDGISRKD